MVSFASKSTTAPALLFEDSSNTSNTANGVAGTLNSGTTTGESSASAVQVLVHPLVLLHVLDHHTRRQEDGGRVIGTLLGRRDGSVVEVTNCFAVPHAERGEEVAIGKDFNKRMMTLYTRTNRRETVVGWYASAATGNSNATDNESSEATPPPPLIADTSSLIHEFYAGETDEGADPIHLVLDTRLFTNELSIRAYKSSQVVVQGEAVGSLFHELPLKLKSNEPETICLNEMIASANKQSKNGDTETTMTTTTTSPTKALEASMTKLHGLLDQTCDFVDSVVDGKVPANAEMGRQLADALASVPRIRPQVLDRLFHDSLQDLLMVTYLANVTQTQVDIAEKLNATLGVEHAA